jgi:hypothetical protein
MCQNLSQKPLEIEKSNLIQTQTQTQNPCKKLSFEEKSLPKIIYKKLQPIQDHHTPPLSTKPERERERGTVVTRRRGTRQTRR